MSSAFLRLWTVLCACLLLAACGPTSETSAPSLLESRQWRLDPGGQETLRDAVQASDWQDLSEWKSWGFGKETIWVRLQLKAAPADMRMPWVVRVRPAFLDYVTLYDPASGLVLRSGDALPPANEDDASINFMFQLPALSHERAVYLQMRTTSARTLHAEVLPYGQAQQLNRLQEWAVGFVMASSAIFAIWAFFQWWGTREKVIGAFALKQLVATGWAFFILGFARVVIGPWLPEGVLTLAASMVFISVISITIWFFGTLIEGYQPARLALRAMKVMACGVAALPVLHLLGHTHLMLAIANKSVFLGFALLLLALLTAMPQKARQPIPLAILLAYLVVYSILNSIPSLIHLNWIEAQRIVLFSSLAHTVLDGIVMFVMLQIRARTLRREQMQIAMDLQRSHQRAEDEKRHREEQSQLFAMLAHEMKTPLATLRMWMEAGQLKPETMERAISDMNQVIERCVHTGQLADQGLQPSWQTVDPASLTQSCIQSCRAPSLVKLQAPDNADCLQTDAQMLSIVLGNLLDNACKYSPLGSRIELLLEKSKLDGREGWLWQIRSQAGPAGLPDAHRLFEKYYRSPQARRLSGSGLGLFLVKGLLDLMQGGIRYEAQDGHAVFKLWLPLQPQAHR